MHFFIVYVVSSYHDAADGPLLTGPLITQAPFQTKHRPGQVTSIQKVSSRKNGYTMDPNDNESTLDLTALLTQ